MLHRQLGQDFYWDNELDWTPVGAAAGHSIVEAGQLGTLDGRRHRDLLDELTAEPDHRSVDEVFGAQPVPERTPSPQEFAAKVNALASAEPGKWFTYKGLRERHAQGGQRRRPGPAHGEDCRGPQVRSAYRLPRHPDR
ncbi:hypothetical protein ACLBYD_26510 [Rhodococcus sp. C26F]